MNAPRSAGALVAALAVTAALAGCGRDDSGTALAPAPTEVPASATPLAEPSPTATATARTVRRTVYYLVDGDRDVRLYKEEHERPASPGVVRDAVTAMFEEKPHDPDYTSLWPEGTRLLGARIDGDLLVLDLSAEAGTGRAGAAFEAASLQQLVWTATTAAPRTRRVQVLIEGERRETLWGHVDVSRPIPRGDHIDVLGFVWLDVEQGATLRRGASFGGEATVFEATVNWEWRAGGKVVKSGFSTASEGAPGRGTWKAEVDVPPGTYELRAFESSAEDGRPLHVDTKTVTVTA